MAEPLSLDAQEAARRAHELLLLASQPGRAERKPDALERGRSSLDARPGGCLA